MPEIPLRTDAASLPRHVAVIMDGNGRWAQSRGQERTFGHRSAINAVRNVINACNEIHIPYLTLYTFSSENWRRPEGEVNELMSILAETLLTEGEEIFSKGLRLHVIGDIAKLPTDVRNQLQNIIEHTKDNKNGNLILALSYGSQKEIVAAAQALSREVQAGNIQPGDIDEAMFEAHLYTKDFPPVDLVIRTSGEMRISNFMLWQIAYAELIFLDILWPDFTREDFFRCIAQYQAKERRYGKTGDQIKSIN